MIAQPRDNDRDSEATGSHRPRAERGAGRAFLIGAALVYLGLFVLLPFIVVFGEAFAKGVGSYLASLADPKALSAMWLTLTVALIVVPLNLVFGVASAWAIAKYEFRGKSALVTLIDLPFAVSPVIAGLIYGVTTSESCLPSPASSLPRCS